MLSELELYRPSHRTSPSGDVESQLVGSSSLRTRDRAPVVFDIHQYNTRPAMGHDRWWPVMSRNDQSTSMYAPIVGGNVCVERNSTPVGRRGRHASNMNGPPVSSPLKSHRQVFDCLVRSASICASMIVASGDAPWYGQSRFRSGTQYSPGPLHGSRTVYTKGIYVNRRAHIVGVIKSQILAIISYEDN